MTEDQKEAVPTPPNSPSWSEPLLLAFTSAAGYLTAFAYEGGVAAAYGIPFQLIDLRLTTIFIALSSTLGALYILPFVIDIASRLSWKHRGPIGREFGPLIPFGVLWLLLATVLGRDLWRASLLIALLILSIPATNLIVPMLTFRNVKGYRAKLQANAQAEGEFAKSAITYRTFAAYPRVTTLGLLLVAWLLLAASAGFGRALQAEHFYTIPGSPEMIVLRFYGDKVVLGSVDRVHHYIRRRYRVVPFPADLQFTDERLGRLALEPLPSSNLP